MRATIPSPNKNAYACKLPAWNKRKSAPIPRCRHSPRRLRRHRSPSDRRMRRCGRKVPCVLNRSANYKIRRYKIVVAKSRSSNGSLARFAIKPDRQQAIPRSMAPVASTGTFRTTCFFVRNRPGISARKMEHRRRAQAERGRATGRSLRKEIHGPRGRRAPRFAKENDHEKTQNIKRGQEGRQQAPIAKMALLRS